jgi:hypothetical protein
VKRLGLACLAALTLAACSLAPAKFDQVEQLGWASLWQKATQLGAACGDAAKAGKAAGELSESSELLGAYLQFQADDGSRELMAHYRALLAKFDPRGGVTYCRESALNLQQAASRGMQVNGGRER